MPRDNSAIVSKVMDEYKRLVKMLDECAGDKGNLINKAIRRLATLDPFKVKKAESDPSYQAEIREAIERAVQFWHLRDGLSADANFTKAFWDSPEGRLLGKAQNWLMADDLISRTDALMLIRGLDDPNDIVPTDRVWMHSRLYPRKNKRTLFTIYARDMLSRDQVLEYIDTPEAQAALEADRRRKEAKHKTIKNEWNPKDAVSQTMGKS